MQHRDVPAQQRGSRRSSRSHPTFRDRAPARPTSRGLPGRELRRSAPARPVALTAPEDYGGAGLWIEGRFTPFYELLEALAYADCSTAQLLQVHSHALGVLSRHRTPEQRERYLSQIVQGGQLLASVGSETGAERARSRASTRRSSSATATAGGLTCTKHFASLAPAADWLLSGSRCRVGALPRSHGDGAGAARRARGELVDEWDVMGMRPTVSWGVRDRGPVRPAARDHRRARGWVRDDPRTLHARLRREPRRRRTGGARLRARLGARSARTCADIRPRRRPRSASSRRRCTAPAVRSSPRPRRGTQGRLGARRGRVADGRAPGQARGARRRPAGRSTSAARARRSAVPARGVVPRRAHVHAARPRRRPDARARARPPARRLDRRRPRSTRRCCPAAQRVAARIEVDARSCTAGAPLAATRRPA